MEQNKNIKDVKRCEKRERSERRSKSQTLNLFRGPAVEAKVVEINQDGTPTDKDNKNRTTIPERILSF
jgi:hypothetical protein